MEHSLTSFGTTMQAKERRNARKRETPPPNLVVLVTASLHLTALKTETPCIRVQKHDDGVWRPQPKNTNRGFIVFIEELPPNVEEFNVLLTEVRRAVAFGKYARL